MVIVGINTTWVWPLALCSPTHLTWAAGEIQRIKSFLAKVEFFVQGNISIEIYFNVGSN